MPMGGGTFAQQNKVLPGAYINFVSQNRAVSMGSRGVASLPLAMSWGPEKAFVVLEAEEFYKSARKVLGYDPTDGAVRSVRECLKRASKLLLWRVDAGGKKAAATVGGLTVTAKYPGKRGNDIKVAVEAVPEGGFAVTTWLDTVEADEQTVADGGALKENDYVSFVGTTLSAGAAVPLTGGTDGAADVAGYTAYLDALEVESFTTFGYPGADSAVQELCAAFAKRLRDSEGKKITCVMAGKAADHEGVINVKNGVVLEDGAVLDKGGAVAWVAGATAGAEVNESLTNAYYDGAVDVDVKYTAKQYEAAIKAGEFCFYAEGGKARVLTDVNSLTTFTGGKSEDWTSNRVIRVLDGWANDCAAIFAQRYIGLQGNDDTGRALFKADLVALALQYQAMRAIQNFESGDVAITQGVGKRDVAVQCALCPVDSMEKLYMTVSVE